MAQVIRVRRLNPQALEPSNAATEIILGWVARSLPQMKGKVTAIWTDIFVDWDQAREGMRLLDYKMPENLNCHKCQDTPRQPIGFVFRFSQVKQGQTEATTIVTGPVLLWCPKCNGLEFLQIPT